MVLVSIVRVVLTGPRITRVRHARSEVIKVIAVLLAHLARLAITVTRVVLVNTARVVIA